jgi:hypothetical protein
VGIRRDPPRLVGDPHDGSIFVFLIFLACRDRDYVEAATSSKLAIGTGDQDDAIALALASNMTATDLDISEIAVARHRCQTDVRSHALFHLPLARFKRAGVYQTYFAAIAISPATTMISTAVCSQKLLAKPLLLVV